MSTVWMRMPGQSWLAAAASFVGMWTLMMVPMMLPSVAPALWRYRRARAWGGVRRPTLHAGIAGLAYFLVWGAAGLMVYPLGMGVAATMEQPVVSRLAPVAAGLTVILAGVWQFTPWKAHHLAGCGRLPPSVAPARQYGVRLGLRCAGCCANLMLILLVTGMMDLRAMIPVGAAITAERLTAASERVARASGAVIVVAGSILVWRTLVR